MTVQKHFCLTVAHKVFSFQSFRFDKMPAANRMLNGVICVVPYSRKYSVCKAFAAIAPRLCKNDLSVGLDLKKDFC